MSNFIPPYIYEQYLRGNRGGEFEAATLFVDISGFTQLTESLMRHTKDGAEVLADALDSIFNPLVAEVHKRGGLIPLYAGDAFTAVFPVSSPEETEAAARAGLRAVQTALSIQRFLAEDGNERVFTTKYGNFQIGAKVGLSLGGVVWGIVETAPRHVFYFRGSAIEGCTKAEKVAARGQIAADAKLLELLGHEITTEPSSLSPNHNLVISGGTRTSPTEGVRCLGREECAPFVPAEILDLPVRAEFREVCPVFLSFEEPAEEAPLRDFIEELTIMSGDYGGHVHQIEFGDKGGMAILLFGAPSAHEHSVERAARFVLGLRARCDAIRWRCGMTFGAAWAGIRGNEHRCEYAVIGDVVNLAARLAMRADWHAGWVSDRVFERLRNSFRFNEVGELQIRGKTERHRAYAFRDKHAPRKTTPYAQAMVAREDELSAIESFLRPLFQRRFAGMLHIHGDPGIGKSRLMYELRHRLEKKHDITWFTCPADPILQQSLHPFRRFLRDYFEISDDLQLETSKQRFSSAIDSLRFSLQTLPSSTLDSGDVMAELERTRPFLGAFLNLEWEGSLYGQLEPRLRLENMKGALKTLMRAEGVRRPVVIHLEDAQWFDDDSRDLVRLLMRNVEHVPLALICTSRYHDDGSCITFKADESVPQKSIELKSLDQGDIQSLGTQLIGGPLSEPLRVFLGNKTGGNPFFVEQLLLDLQERGALQRDGDGTWALRDAETAVPTKISAVLVARLDRLSSQVKTVVQTAAVLGSEFEVRILSRMLQNEEDVPLRVKEAESQQMWSAVNELRYLFRHVLMRDAAYEMQLQKRLLSLHRLAAEAIEQIYASDLSASYADLAYHWGHAAVAERERHYAKAAGKGAIGRHALDEAFNYFTRALELTPEDAIDEVYAIHREREYVAAMKGRRDVQLSDIHRMEALAKELDDAARQADVAIRKAHYLEATGDFIAAIGVAREAIACGQESRDVGKEAAGYRLWAGALLRQGDSENARGQLDRALFLARRANDQQEETTVLLNLGTVCRHMGEYRDAQSWYEEALRLARRRNDQSGEGLILNNLGSVLYHAGDRESAVSYFRESLRICRTIGYRLAECNALGNLATVSADRGDYAASRADYEEALRVRREIGDRQGECLTLNNLGKIAGDLGNYKTAKSYLSQALHLAQQLGVRPILGAVHVNLSSLFLWAGNHAEAQRHGDEALEIAEELGELRMAGYAHIARGHALRGQRRLEDAAGAYQESARIRRQLGQETLALEAEGGLARVALLQGDAAAALTYVEQILHHLAAGSLEGMSEPFAVYLTCYDVLAAHNDPRADEVLSQACARLRDQAARIGDARMRDAFLHGVATHARLLETHETMERG